MRRLDAISGNVEGAEISPTPQTQCRTISLNPKRVVGLAAGTVAVEYLTGTVECELKHDVEAWKLLICSRRRGQGERKGGLWVIEMCTEINLSLIKSIP